MLRVDWIHLYLNVVDNLMSSKFLYNTFRKISMNYVKWNLLEVMMRCIWKCNYFDDIYIDQFENGVYLSCIRCNNRFNDNVFNNVKLQTRLEQYAFRDHGNENHFDHCMLTIVWSQRPYMNGVFPSADKPISVLII